MKEKMPNSGEFCWNELMTSNTNDATKFYQAMFGWECQTQPVNDTEYTMFKRGENFVNAGMMQMPRGENMPPHWMSYIYVEDLDAMVQKARSLGAQVKVPATMAGDYGRFAIIVDPTGAHFGLWQSMKAMEGCC